MAFRRKKNNLMDEFVSSEKNLTDREKCGPLRIGTKYATTLTGFLAGIVVGMLAEYIILSLYAK